MKKMAEALADQLSEDLEDILDPEEIRAEDILDALASRGLKLVADPTGESTLAYQSMIRQGIDG